VRLQLTKQGLGLDDAFMLAATVSINTTDEGGFPIFFLITEQISCLGIAYCGVYNHLPNYKIWSGKAY